MVFIHESIHFQYLSPSALTPMLKLEFTISLTCTFLCGKPCRLMENMHLV